MVQFGSLEDHYFKFQKRLNKDYFLKW
jgi:hypothetical protein